MGLSSVSQHAVHLSCPVEMASFDIIEITMLGKSNSTFLLHRADLQSEEKKTLTSWRKCYIPHFLPYSTCPCQYTFWLQQNYIRPLLSDCDEN